MKVSYCNVKMYCKKECGVVEETADTYMAVGHQDCALSKLYPSFLGIREGHGVIA